MVSPLQGSIRKTVAKAMKGLFLDAIITRDVISGGDVWNPSSTTTQTFACKAIFEEYGVAYRKDGLVQAGDMKVLILAETLATDPLPLDKVTLDGKTLQIVPANTSGEPPVKTDPAKATWACRAKA